MADRDDDDDDMSFALPLHFTKYTGEITEEELSSGLATLTGTALSMSSEMARKMINREDAHYHLLAVGVAVKDGEIRIHEVGHDGELPNGVWFRVLLAVLNQIRSGGPMQEIPPPGTTVQ